MIDFNRAFSSYISPEISRSLLPPTSVYFDRYSRGASLYPRQQTLMKIIFLEIDQLTEYDRYVIDEWLESTRRNGDVAIPLDIYDRMRWCKENGYKHFYEVINCSGRRGGKGFIGGKIAEYMVASMLALGNPQRYYGIDDSKQMHIDVLATNFSQAQGMLYNDIKDAVLMDDFIAPYIYSTSNSSQKLRTVADFERDARLKRDAKERKALLRSTVTSIVIEPHAATSTSIRGRASFMICFDEFAHLGSDSSAVYNASTPSLAQFGKDGMVYIPSSPWSETGKFYDLYCSAMATDAAGRAQEPSSFVIRAPSWEWYKDYQYDPRKKLAVIQPPETSLEMRARELQDPETFAVEFRSRFAKTENAYLQAAVVDAMFEPYPSVQDNRNMMRGAGVYSTQYVAHADAGRSQDFFAFVLGHKERMDDGQHHVFIDLYKVWQPIDFPIGDDGVRRIDYMEVIRWMENVLKRFYVTKLTFDQWNSGLFVDKLREDARKGMFYNNMIAISVDNHTAVSNFTRWERFKTAVYQGWVHVPYMEQEVMGLGKCCLIQEELKLLVVKNGNKVDHQDSGGYQHNDASDCLSTVTVNLLGDQTDLVSIDAGVVVGAAQGGYNSGVDVQRSHAIDRQMDEAMRLLGYDF